MKFSLLMLVMFSLKSCGNTNAIASMQESTIQQLSGTYTISGLGDNDSLTIHPDITFDASTNHVLGFSGCNRFNGSYTIDGNNITFGPMASTRMMCREEANTIERQMLDALSQVNSFLLNDNELTLLKDKTTLIKAKQDNSYVIEYRAVSRGSFHQIIISDRIISNQKDRDSKPTTKTCDKDEWNLIMSNLKNVEIGALPKIEPPSKAHQYDGAAIATLKITHSGKDYQTQSFDHGNPPKEIESLVKEILSMAGNIE